MIGPLYENEFLNISSEAGGTTVIFDASDILVTLFATSEHIVIALHIYMGDIPFIHLNIVRAIK